MSKEHSCKEMVEQKQMAYICNFSVRYLKEEKVWVISAEEEYESTINFCPFCGKHLEKKKI